MTRRRKSDTVSLGLNLMMSNAIITPTPGKPQPDGITDMIDYVLGILETETEDQGLIINANKHKPRTAFTGSKGKPSDPLIRDNMTIPEPVRAHRDTTWSNTAWSLITSQLETYRLLAPWQERSEVYADIQATPSLGYKDFKKKHGYAHLDYGLWKNVRQSTAPPSVPLITSARIPYSKMGTQCCGAPRYDRRTGIMHWDSVNIGRAWLDFAWYAPWLKRAFSKRALADGRISKPTLQGVPRDPFTLSIGYLVSDDGSILTVMNRDATPVRFHSWSDDVRLSFTLTMGKPAARRALNSVTGFDIGMESHAVIAGRRVCSNGTYSRPLTLTREGSALQQHILSIEREYDRVMAKIARIKADDQGEPSPRLVEQAKLLWARRSALHDALDWAAADAMVKHAGRGGVLVIEELSWSGGGIVKFRHGQVADHVDHLAAKRGVRVERVNAAGSSHECPRCHGEYDANPQDHSFKCPACGYEGDKDDAAGFIIALRGLTRLKLNHDNNIGIGTVQQAVTPRYQRVTRPSRVPTRSKVSTERATSTRSGTGRSPRAAHSINFW